MVSDYNLNQSVRFIFGQINNYRFVRKFTIMECDSSSRLLDGYANLPLGHLGLQTESCSETKYVRKLPCFRINFDLE
jgi:hypothetical protein